MNIAFITISLSQTEANKLGHWVLLRLTSDGQSDHHLRTLTAEIYDSKGLYEIYMSRHKGELHSKGGRNYAINPHGCYK